MFNMKIIQSAPCHDLSAMNQWLLENIPKKTPFEKFSAIAQIVKSQFGQNYTPEQLQGRVYRLRSKETVTVRGAFSPQEDAELQKFVNTHGGRNFRTLAANLGRSTTSIHQRYKRLLDKKLLDKSRPDQGLLGQVNQNVSGSDAYAHESTEDNTPSDACLLNAPDSETSSEVSPVNLEHFLGYDDNETLSDQLQSALQKTANADRLILDGDHSLLTSESNPAAIQPDPDDDILGYFFKGTQTQCLQTQHAEEPNTALQHQTDTLLCDESM